MRYSLMMHYTELAATEVTAEVMAEGQRAMSSYASALQEAGALVSAEVLQPSAVTTTLTLVDGEARVQDGPFADTKEQLGGVFVLDVPDLDAALAWAKKAPAAGWGAVEVRPIATFTEAGVWQPNQ